MIATRVVRDLHEHRLWTRLRVLEAAAGLDAPQLRRGFEMGLGSVHATLVHLYGAELVWLHALEETTVPRFPEPADFEGLPSLLRAWSDLDERWGRFLDHLTEESLSRPTTRTNRAGVTYTTPASDVLVHVCTHAFYHTAQVVNMLRHLGVAPLPETNFITFARERAGRT